MKFYLYCVTDVEPNLAELVGLERQAFQVVNNGGLFVVASRFEGDIVAVTRENVLQHEAIVRKIFSTSTVLPFRFGTSVTATGLKSYLASHETALFERLSQVRDCVEMSVKIIWQNSSEIESEAEPAIPDLDQVGAGTAFLMFKRQELIGNERLEQQAHDLGDWLRGGLKDVVHQEQVTIESRQRLVVSASYLVERARLPDYRRELAKLQAERSTLHFLSSGPWPPYTFANIDLEFGTHFGVS